MLKIYLYFKDYKSKDHHFKEENPALGYNRSAADIFNIRSYLTLESTFVFPRILKIKNFKNS